PQDGYAATREAACSFATASIGEFERPCPRFSFWRRTPRAAGSSARNTNETVFRFDETRFRHSVLNSSYHSVTNGRRVARRNSNEKMRPMSWKTRISSLLKKLARAKGVVIHFPGVILREGEDARTVPGSGRPFLVHPAGGADSGGSSAARDTQAR